MRGVEHSLYDFLVEHPGQWSDRELADRIFCSRSSIVRGLKALKQKGLIEVSVRRKKFNGWWVQREVKVKENR